VLQIKLPTWISWWCTWLRGFCISRVIFIIWIIVTAVFVINRLDIIWPSC